MNIDEKLRYLPSEQCWSTDEFSLATALVALGFPIEAYDNDPKYGSRVKFVFKKTEALVDAETAFWKGTLTIEPRSFHHAERDLKARIRSLFQTEKVD